MKGYLHRLAAQAVGVRGGVHPIVGSIYAGTELGNFRGESDYEPITKEEQEVIKPRRVSVERENPGPRREQSRIAGDVGEQRAGRVAADEGQGRNPVPSGAVFEPLVKRVEGDAAFSPIHREVAETEPATARTQFVPDKTERLDAEPRYIPLLQREAASAYGPQPQRHETAPQTANHGREAAGVQIHIERIEVTAVTEPQRPPAVRTRKSLDLGEYLKRRDGRVG
jgi:hypothetical protein